MASIRITLALCTSLVFAFSGLCARAQYQYEICIKKALASQGATAMGFAPSEVQTLVAQETDAIGVPSLDIKIVPCEGVEKVRSDNVTEQDIRGEYIFYNPVWVREVLGPDIEREKAKEAWDQAAFLFGHELGHIIGRHFTSRAYLPAKQKEEEADGFSGCAAGALGEDWNNINAFILKVRSDAETGYPTAAESRAVAKGGSTGAVRGFWQHHKRRTSPERQITSGLLKRSVRWYAEKPITDPNADDPRNVSQHSLWLDMDPELLSKIVSATWVIHDSNLKQTTLRNNSEHLEFPFRAFGCWDLATVTGQLTNGRPVVADFNECKATPSQLAQAADHGFA